MRWYKILRGGSFISDAAIACSAFRYVLGPTDRIRRVGVRQVVNAQFNDGGRADPQVRLERLE